MIIVGRACVLLVAGTGGAGVLILLVGRTGAGVLIIGPEHVFCWYAYHGPSMCCAGCKEGVVSWAEHVFCWLRTQPSMSSGFRRSGAGAHMMCFCRLQQLQLQFSTRRLKELPKDCHSETSIFGCSFVGTWGLAFGALGTPSMLRGCLREGSFSPWPVLQLERKPFFGGQCSCGHCRIHSRNRQTV